MKRVMKKKRKYFRTTKTTMSPMMRSETKKAKWPRKKR